MAMTKQQIDECVRHRLHLWADHFVKLNCTPVLMLGIEQLVGTHSWYAETLEGITDEEVLLMLEQLTSMWRRKCSEKFLGVRSNN